VLILPATPIPAPVLDGKNAIERARQLIRRAASTSGWFTCMELVATMPGEPFYAAMGI